MADPNSVRRQSVDFNPQVGLQPNPGAAGTSFNFVPAQRVTTLDEGLKALSQLEPKIDAFFARRDREQEEKDTAEGRAKQLELAMSDGDAVREGKLSPNQSKWFMKGYRSQYGETLGQQWALEAKTQWTEGDAKNSDDPEAAKKFIQNFMSEKLKDAAAQDPDVRAGMLPVLRQTGQTILAAQAEWQAKKIKETHLDNVGIAIANDIDLFRQGKMSRDQLMQSIQQRDAAGLLIGIDKEDMKKTLVQAFTEKAKSSGDVSLLNTLKSIPFIGNNPKYGGPINAAEAHINSQAASNEVRAEARERRARAENERVGLLAIYDRMLTQAQKGERVVPTAVDYEIAKKTGVPDAILKVGAFADKMNEQTQKDDPETVNRLLLDLARGGAGAMERLETAFERGQIKEKSNIATAISYAKAAESFQNDRSFWEPASQILNNGPKDLMGQPAKITKDGADRFQRTYIEFVRNNPKATEADKMEFAIKAKKMIEDDLNQYRIGEGRTLRSGESAIDFQKLLTESKSADEMLKKLPPDALKALTDEQLRQINAHFANKPQQKK